MSQPTTLNPLSSTDAYSTRVHQYVIDTLAKRNNDTYEWEPALAESWETSEDGLSFVFNLRKGVQWHDGKPFTADDVAFSYDAIMNKDNKYKTATKRPYFENIEKYEILSSHKIKFYIKKKYFGNFAILAGDAQTFNIVPKHLYEDPSEEQEKKLNKTLIGTGPYKFEKWRRGNQMLLVKNKEWWGNEIYKDENNFDQIRIRFIKEGNIALQRLANGDLDFYAMQPEEYVKKTSGDKWGKSLIKVKYNNEAPRGYAFIAWNLKNELFKNREVRLALNKLVDRKTMNEKYDYGLNVLATGPWYRQSIYADPNVKEIGFDPQGALKLLRENGWKDTDGDQVLDKVINGKKKQFKFTILEPWKGFSKYLVTFQQDAKKVGVEVEIKVIEWNTFITLLNERKFEAVRLAWSQNSLDNDPKQVWHSDSIENAGSNFISYNNPKVDALIDKARSELEREKRIPLMREVYREIANDFPYVFLFNSKFGFYGHSEKIVKPKDTYRYSVGLGHWKFATGK